MSTQLFHDASIKNVDFGFATCAKLNSYSYYSNTLISDTHLPSENMVFDFMFSRVVIQYLDLKTRSSRKWGASQSKSCHFDVVKGR